MTVKNGAQLRTFFLIQIATAGIIVHIAAHHITPFLQVDQMQGVFIKPFPGKRLTQTVESRQNVPLHFILPRRR